MSGTNKWVVWAAVAGVVVVAALWWSGAIGANQSAGGQAASAAQGAGGSTASTNAAIIQSNASVVTQIQKAAAGLAVLANTSVAANVSVAGTMVNAIINAESSLVTALQSRLATDQGIANSAALQAQLKTIGDKLLQASAKAGKANSDLAGLKAGQTANNATITAGAIAGFQSALATAVSVNTDLQAVVKAITGN